MCGIAGFYARESVPDNSVFDILFKWTEKRGQDGFGIVICRKDKYSKCLFLAPYSQCRDSVLSFVRTKIQVGDIVLAISRAAPETEPATSSDNMQPIVNHDCVLVHNGAIASKIDKEITIGAAACGFKRITEIDSESIILSYRIHNNNIKDAMEHISGGVAALMYDQVMDKLYIINDFKPIAHGYVRGVGYFLASDNNCLQEIIAHITSCNRDGVCVWENFYHHYLSGGRIKVLDPDSGFIQNIKYSPRYLTQSWDSNQKQEEKELCLVAASGGLDSSLTLAMLKLAGYENIVACHFKYGHRGEAAEESAIQHVCQKLDILCKVFDITALMQSIDTTSMLIDKNAKITTGTQEGLKKLDAWVNGRNMMFMSIMATYAESLVMKHGYTRVNLLGGMLSLTESGTYPDNSEYFISSCLEMFKYGTLIGNRIFPMFGLCDLMKSDLFYLIREFDLFDIYRHTISCDRPIVDDGVARNCSKNGIPACGSGLLSYWASKLCNMDDMRMREFYEVEDEQYRPHVPKHMETNNTLKKDITNIISRIHFPPERLDILLSRVGQPRKVEQC